MNDEKPKRTLGAWMKDWLTPTVVFSGILYFAVQWSEYKATSRTVQFDDEAQKTRVIDRALMIPSDIDAYIRVMQLDSTLKAHNDWKEEQLQRQKYEDSVNKLRDVTTYQTKQVLKLVLEKLDKLDKR